MRASVRSGLPARQLTSLLVVLVVALGSLVATSTPSQADVTSATGSAFGYFVDASLGDQNTQEGPAPFVELAPDASNSPQDDSVGSAEVTLGPATLFASGQIDVHTEGAIGEGGYAASSADVQGPEEQNDPFHYESASSSCRAEEGATSGTTTITGGQVVSESGTQSVPTNPDPNTSFTGTVPGAGDEFRITFNEQTVGPDGGLTVNAVHVELLGPIATGDVIIGQSVCGVNAAQTTSTTTTTTTTTTVPTTTTAPSTNMATASTTTTGASTAATAPRTTTAAQTARSAATTSNGDGSASTAGVSQVAGSAYGYFVDAALGQDLTIQEGPEPLVELAPDASNSPQDDSLGSAEVTLGPATLFGSGQINVHTEGAIGEGWYVESSADVQGPAEPLDPFHFDAASSSCRAEEGGTSGTTTITGGQVVSESGTQPVATNPDPNTSFTGTVPGAGDEFRITFNEQITEDGTLTVNAAHLELLGPIATGDVIIGQSVCGGAADTGDAAGADQDAGTTDTTGGTAGQLAHTGSDPRPLTALSAVLMILGLAMIRGARRRSAAPGLDGTGR